MTFPTLLWRFPWISAHYLGVWHPHREIIALYTCCKYRVSRHGCQIKLPCSTFVVVCSTSVCHEPAHNTFVYCFLITAGGCLEMFRLAVTTCLSTFKVTEFRLISAFKPSQTPLNQHPQMGWSAVVAGKDWTWKTLLHALVTRPSLCNPVDCSPPGSSVHGILQARTLEGLAIPSLGILATQALNLSLLHCKRILYHLSLYNIH